MNMIRVKKIFLDPRVYLLPIVFLISISRTTIIVAVSIYILGICILREKINCDICIKKNPIIILQAVIISDILGKKFYRRWTNSFKIDKLLGYIGIKNTKLFCLCCSVLLVGLSICSLCIVLYFYYSLAQKNNAHQFYKFSSNLIKAGDVCLAIVLALFVGAYIAFRPFSKYSLKIDESVFMYIGKQMLSGKVPYRDLFDHKGIILYFFNYLGFLISDNSYLGIWLVCVVNAFAFALMQIKLLNMFTDNKTIILISQFIIMWLFAVKLDNSANMTEGYALPWITLTLYICLKYIMKGSYKIYEMVLIGVSFAVIFFLRPNMIGVFVLIPIILVSMLIRKKKFEILRCIVACIIGVLLICIPVMIYFLKTDSLSYMIKYYLKFNLIYSGKENSIGTVCYAMLALVKALRVSPLLLILLGIPLSYRDKVYICNIVAWFSSLTLASMSGKTYPHYAVVLLPMTGVLCCYFLQSLESKIPFKIKNVKMYQLIGILALVFIIFDIHLKRPIITTTYASADGVDNYIIKNTSKNDNVLIIGNRVCHYLYTNRFTENKFFYQTPPANISEEIYQDFLNEFNENLPDYLIFENIEQYEEGESNMRIFWEYINNLEIYKRFDYEKFSVFKKN